jgi:hypothetical protein
MINPNFHRLVFIGGLHRSGTSALHRALATHPEVSCFSSTGVSEDEGQHLQDVYPAAHKFGGAGRFGFYPAARLLEDSPLVSEESRRRLLASWSVYWDLEKRVLVEKSPPNLIRARFLRALFPNASFVFVVRHPVPVALSTMKWSHLSITASIEHWLVCHEFLLEDLPFISRYIIIRYEDFVARPEAEAARIAGLLDVGEQFDMTSIRGGANADYFKQWKRLKSHRSRRHYKLASGLNMLVFGEKIRAIEYSREIEDIEIRFAKSIGRFGYRFLDDHVSHAAFGRFPVHV